MSSPTEKPGAESNEWGYDLLLYGHEQMLRGSDNGVLVAFAAIAFQEVRDERQPHHHVGFGFLLVSVLMCAVVHFAMGNAYVGRAKRLIFGRKETTPQAAARRAYTAVACVAGLVQLLCIIVGLLLVLLPQPPALLRDYLLPWFG